MIIKIVITLFVLFAASRAYLRYRDGSVRVVGLIIWLVLWCGVAFFTWWPKVSDILATNIGIGRGVDALVYLSIVALFYAVFRIYVKLEFIGHELTSLVRNLALKDQNRNK
jgi:small membrane protein